MTTMTAEEHEARQQRFARILIEEANKLINAAAASTPVGGGDITPTAADRATSLASLSGEAAAVAPPKPDDSPAAAGADEIWQISAVDRSDRPRTIYSADSDGTLRIHRKGMPTLELNAAEIDELADFINSTTTIRGQA